MSQLNLPHGNKNSCFSSLLYQQHFRQKLTTTTHNNNVHSMKKTLKEWTQTEMSFTVPTVPSMWLGSTQVSRVVHTHAARYCAAQVVHTREPLSPSSIGQWCATAGKVTVGLVSHVHRGTDAVPVAVRRATNCYTPFTYLLSNLLTDLSGLCTHARAQGLTTCSSVGLTKEERWTSRLNSSEECTDTLPLIFVANRRH